jgi:hypothetical protein
VVFGLAGETQVEQAIHILVTVEQLIVLSTNVSNQNFSRGSMIPDYLVVLRQAF